MPSPDPRPATRRAVLAHRPERPLGVAVVTGVLWMVGVMSVVWGPAIIIGASIDAARGGLGAPDQETLLIVSLFGIGFFVVGVLLIVVGAANGAGRRWAWTGLAAGALIVGVPAGIYGVLLSFAEPNFAFVGGTIFGVAVGLLLLTRYYRRADVREFFGLPPARKGKAASGPR